MLHLADAGQKREDLAVDRLMTLMPDLHPLWFESLGLQPFRHWAMLRPQFRGLHSRHAEVEVDLVLGPVTPSGDLSLDHLVGVEAKCWNKKWSDIEDWSRGPHRKSNLWQQVLRNHEVGFNRVAGLDIIVTPPSGSYWEAMGSADVLGNAERDWLVKAAKAGRAVANAGYALVALGAVLWKDESESGTLPMFECEEAPMAPTTRAVLRDSVCSVLDQCPRDGHPPYCFRKTHGHWTNLLVSRMSG